MRKNIPAIEIRVGVLVVAGLVLAGLWLSAQHDNFDPGDRDISIELLREQSVEDTLYKAPLQTWVEPGSAAALHATPDLGIFPTTTLEGGWQMDGRIEVYDASNVYEKINGAAEQYIKFGFEKLHYLSIQKDDALISIEIYDQGEFQNTLGIFAAQRSAKRGVSSSGAIFSYETPVGAVGGFEQYYFKVAGNSEANETREKAMQIASAMSTLPVEASSAPRSYALLSGDLGMPFDQISYEKNDAFQYDFTDDFWFAAPEPGADYRIWIHQATDEATAKTLFDKLATEQGYEYSAIEQSAGGALFQHEFLGTFFAMHRRGNVVYGVDGAADRKLAEYWSGKIEKGLNDG